MLLSPEILSLINSWNNIISAKVHLELINGRRNVLHISAYHGVYETNSTGSGQRWIWRPEKRSIALPNEFVMKPSKPGDLLLKLFASIHYTVTDWILMCNHRKSLNMRSIMIEGKRGWSDLSRSIYVSFEATILSGQVSKN